MEICVSVVIPTYQRPELLNRCLEALLRQDFPEGLFEIIVVTDGPDPLTAQSVARREDWFLFRVYSTEEKKGPAAARNLGWRMAAGRLVLFTDDDCLPGKYWIRAYWLAYQICLQFNVDNWTFGPALAFHGPISVPRPERPTDFERNTAGLETAEFVTANCACSRSALELVDGFDESFTMAWREDSELEFKFIKDAIPILHVPAARVVHPVRKAGWGVSLKEQKKSMFNALLYKKHPFLFRKKIYPHPLWSYYIIAVSALTASVAALFQFWVLTIAAAAIWAGLTTAFVIKRLSGASRTFSHITEMILTSMVIPFLSIYWTVYGAIRYKTFFL